MPFVAIERQEAGAAAFRTADFRSALGFYCLAARASPRWAEPRFGAAQAHLRLGDRIAAITEAKAAFEIDPTHAAAAHLAGACLCELDSWEEARPWLKTAAELQPDTPIFQRDYSVVLLFHGDIEAGRQAMLRTVQLDVFAPEILFTLSRTTPMDGSSTEGDALFQLLANLEPRTGLMSEAERTQVHFSLAKAYGDRGEVDRAFRHLTEGNALARKRVTYDADETEWQFEAIAETFSSQTIQRLAGMGVSDNRPIFIVGMPRSGSTLVEQILSAHADVFGGGELPHLRATINGTRGPMGELFPYWAPGMDAVSGQRAAEHYLSSLPRGPVGESRTTDKWLDNFKYIGLIHSILPDATIIHCTRDPIDSCLSSYSILFSQEQEFTYSLEELGRHWRAYDRLMKHWHNVLPPGRILDVPYEALVDDLEGWARTITRHCGLDWDPACLKFYDSKRIVRSSSLAQVRQPIFRDSIGRWKPYARHLAPLIAEIFGVDAAISDSQQPQPDAA